MCPIFLDRVHPMYYVDYHASKVCSSSSVSGFACSLGLLVVQKSVCG